MAARPSSGKNGSTTDYQLMAYRLERVEVGVTDLNSKFDRLDNIKKADLLEFRNTIFERINEMDLGLQRQIDGKADKDTTEERWRMVKAIAAFLSMAMASLVVYYLTTGRK